MTIGTFKGKLITAGTNAKTVKGDGSEYVTAIMYLAPATNVAGINLCPMAKIAKCEAPCLFTAGRGVMSNVKAGRVRKTKLFRDDQAGFMALLVNDLVKFSKWSAKHGVKAVVRLNGTSDIRWENIPVERRIYRRNDFEISEMVIYDNVFAAFPEIQFYDYTKILNRRVSPWGNYHLTLSYSGASEDYAGKVTSAAHRQGLNLAVVFRSADSIPATYFARPVINGDADDLRFLDPRGVVVALYAKGSAKKDDSGFVIDPK
jgi:hypothetical protein